MRLLVFFVLILLLLNSCGDSAFQFIANDSSQEACQYKVSKDLDSGNYDAVISSSCASSMDKGAAYFGKAGFDVKDVINRLSEAQNQNQNVEPIDLYMKALVPKVDETTLTNLDNAKTEYGNVPPDSPYYNDAQFYLSLVQAMKTLSLLKIVIDSDGDGQLLTECDINGNEVPDDVDATACALLVSAQLFNNQPPDCSSLNGNNGHGVVTISWSPDAPPGNRLTLKNTQNNNITYSGYYKGLIVNITGSGPSSGCPMDDLYRKKLLYKDSSNNYWVATTTGGTVCEDNYNNNNNNKWPCPIEQNGQPLDLVSAIDEAVQSMIDSMGNALPGVSEDVVNSINQIKTEACGGDNCTSGEIADYIKNINLQNIQ
ncbi:MAG: hypothetical protein ACK4TF_00525 [Thermodesulfovibrionales bacterium]